MPSAGAALREYPRSGARRFNVQMTLVRHIANYPRLVSCAPSSDMADDATPQAGYMTMLGVTAGLVSVTQRAWRLPLSGALQ